MVVALTSAIVNVRMVDTCIEAHLGRLERILYGKVHVDEEGAASIGALGGPLKLCGPLVDVVLLGLDSNAIDGILGEVGELLADTFGRRHLDGGAVT